jgi:hypothetical protein
MRFPKPFGILCATALCASILPVRADDNPAQAAARAAVLQKMQEQDAAGTNVAPAATPPSAPVVVAPVIPVPAQPVVVQPVTTVPAPAPDATMNPTASSTDNAAQAAARAAVLQKMQEQDAAGINAAPADATSSAPVVAAPVTTVSVVTTNPTPAPAPVAAPTVAAPSTPVYRPIIAPSLPISADQQARLQALDAKYSANQITPLDYFTQREAIMKGQ